MKRISLFLIISLFFVANSNAAPIKLLSPDGNLKFQFSLEDKGIPTYVVNYKDQTIIQDSRLGVNSWDQNFKIQNTETSSVNNTWKPVYGERNTVKDNYNAINIDLIRGNNKKYVMQLQVRAYNEGIAFRYFFVEHPNGGYNIGIMEELTEFVMPENTKAWYTSRAQAHYKLLPLKDWKDQCERPLVCELESGIYACLAEAEMVDFSRMKFTLSDEKENTIKCKLYGSVDLINPVATPWRVVMVAEKAGQLLENNDILLNLNPECAIENTDWIKPGKVMREVTLSTDGAKALVDFAVKRNLQYIHFDAGWYGYEYVSSSDATTVTVDPRRNAKGDLNLQEAIKYAKSKGIGVIVYVNQRALYQQLDEILPLYKKWGIAGIKFGFVHVGSHRWTTWMHEAVRKCAEYGLIVDIHDEYRPTGFSRTYPNLMTQEGILGNEGFPDATHNVTLAFTRYIAGAADYTICYYRQDFGAKTEEANGVPRQKFIKTTAAHQLAMAAVYYSPLQYMYWYDKPSDSQDEPELEFFDKVPTVWDDTKVINGEIAEYITVARRSGDEWFVGTLTNNDAREIEIPLNFLPEGTKYEARIYADDPKSKIRTKVGITDKKVSSKTILKTNLQASGGQAIWIKPIK